MKRFLGNYRSSFSLIWIIFAVGAGLLCAGPAWGFDSPGVSLNIYVDQDYENLTYDLGEDSVALIIVLKNTANREIVTERGFSQEELHHALIVTDPNGVRHVLRPGDEAHKMPIPFFISDQAWSLAEKLPADWVKSATIVDLREHVPVMFSTAGWYTIEAQQPFARFAITGDFAGLGTMGGQESANNWTGTIDSNKIQIFIRPPGGALVDVYVLDNSTDPPVKPFHVPVRVFRAAEVSPGSTLANTWDKLEYVLEEFTDNDGKVTLATETGCLSQTDYLVMAKYSDEYKDSPIAATDNGWVSEGCGGLIEKTIAFGEAPQPEVGEFSVFALNSVQLVGKGTVFSGNIGVKIASTGPWLDSAVEVSVGSKTQIRDGVRIYGDSIKIMKGAIVDDVYYNELDNKGQILGDQHTPLDLPVWQEPAFYESQPGDKDVKVQIWRTKDLDPGAYREAVIQPKGTLRLKGGTYHFKSLTLSLAASVVCLEPTTIHIENRFYSGLGAFVGPALKSGFSARDMILYIGGVNGHDGKLASNPKAAIVGGVNKIKANIYAPNGTLWIAAGSEVEGCFIARDVILGLGTEIRLDSAF
jgi:hypothetical protein